MQTELTAVIAHRGKWYVGYVAEIPGVNTQGRTLKEVRENLSEALALILESSRELTEADLANEEVTREPIALVTYRTS